MSRPSPQASAAAATLSFLAGLAAKSPCRLEAKVASAEGMPLLCAVEAALAKALPKSAAQELVWLSAAAPTGSHRLQLQAFGPGNQLLAEAVHEFAG